MRTFVLAVVLGLSACQCGTPPTREDDGGLVVDDDAGAADAGAGDAGVADAGGADAGVADAGVADAGVADAGAVDAGVDAGVADAGVLDPATCPIGAADHCCPLLVHGGSDPDCPSLACQSLHASTVIDLVDDQRDTWKGATGLAWTGSDLALARIDTVWDGGLNGKTVIRFERRSVDGGLTFNAEIDAPQSNFPQASFGATSLAFEPVTNSFAFGFSSYMQAAIAVLGSDGQVRWSAPGHSLCNGFNGTLQTEAAHGSVWLTGDSYTCAGSTGNPSVRRWNAADAGVEAQLLLGDGARPDLSFWSSAACDLQCEHVFTQWAQSYEHFWRAAIVTGADAGTHFSVVPSMLDLTQTSVVSDGANWFTMSVSGGGASFLLLTPSGQRLNPGTPLVTLGAGRMLPPSAIWTGDGYLFATTEWATNTASPNHTDYLIVLYHFAPDGTFRDHTVFETSAYLPRLAWAGGRVAMTFTRVPAHGTETRHLVFFDCP